MTSEELNLSVMFVTRAKYGLIVDRSKTKAIIVRNNQALYVAEASSKLQAS